MSTEISACKKSELMETSSVPVSLAQQRILLDRNMVEMLENIVGGLAAEGVCVASAVCQHWNKVANKDAIWKALCLTEGVSMHNTHRLDYKCIYAEYVLVRKKWLTGEGVTITEIELKERSGQPFVGDVVAMSSRHVFAAKRFRSGDYSVYVFCVETGQCSHQLVGHTDTVRELLLTNDAMTAVSRAHPDPVVRVWNADSGQCLHTLNHPGRTSYMYLQNSVLVCSVPATLYVWNIEAGVQLFQHQAQSFFVQFKAHVGGTHIAVAVPGFIRLLDTNTGACLLSVSFSDRVHQILLIDEKQALVVLTDREWILWDCITGAIRTRQPTRNLSTVTAFNGKLYIAAAHFSGHQCVSVVDPETGSILNTIRGGWEEPKCEAVAILPNEIAVVSLSKGCLSVWDMKKMMHAREISGPKSGLGSVDYRWSVTDSLLQYVTRDTRRQTLQYVTHKFGAEIFLK